MTERTDERFVLDSFAILAFLHGEEGAARVGEILTNGEPWMTLINLGEVVYIVERAHGRATADSLYANLLADERSEGGRTIQWVPIERALVRRAASLKAGGGLSYADCFAGAAAETLGCPVLTGDREFEIIERAGIAVSWL